MFYLRDCNASNDPVDDQTEKKQLENVTLVYFVNSDEEQEHAYYECDVQDEMNRPLTFSEEVILH